MIVEVMKSQTGRRRCGSSLALPVTAAFKRSYNAPSLPLATAPAVTYSRMPPASFCGISGGLKPRLRQSMTKGLWQTH